LVDIDNQRLSNLFPRMWKNLTLALSTTTLSVLVWGVVVPIFVLIGGAFYQGYSQWKPGTSVLHVVTESILNPLVLIWVAITTLAWLFLFVWVFWRMFLQDQKSLSIALADLKRAESEIKSMLVLREHLEQKLEAYENAIQQKEEELKKLKSPELPALRPCVVPVAYAKPQGYVWAGLVIANDGEAAYDISIPPVQIGTSVLEIEPEINRLTKDDGRKYCKVWIRQEHRGTATGNGLMKEMLEQGFVGVGVAILYKDGGNRWYKTTFQLERDVKASGGITTKYLGQELIIRPTEDGTEGNPSNAPELLIEYDHSEQVTWSQEPPSPDKPLVVKNVSEGKNAFNVVIRPLITEDGIAEFQPAVVTCIKGGGQAEFNARVDGAHPYHKNQLLHLLGKSYKERVPGYDIERDLFGTKSFALTVEYTDSSGLRYAADCEITYRTWKNEIHPGKHRIRKIP
jgi:hypothetical protein